MKNKILKPLCNILIIIMIIKIFNNKELLIISIEQSLVIFKKSILPYMFIIIILEHVLIKYNFIYYLNQLVKRVIPVNTLELFLLFMAFLCGSPTNAIIINDLIISKQISIETANKVIKYIYFSNPLFLYGVLTMIYPSSHVPLVMIISHYFANIILFLFNRIKKNATYIIYNNTEKLFSVLKQGIEKSVNTNLMIFGTVTLFMIMTNYTPSINNMYLRSAISGFLEITQGLYKINSLPNGLLKEIITIAIISFGGLSIHMQMFALLERTKVSYKSFLIGRIEAIFLGILLYLLITCIYIHFI